jgi:predicted metal-binding membrane protein
MWSAPREDHNRLFIALMAALAALAWLALWILGRPGGLFHNHHGGSLDAFGGSGAFMLVFVAGWTVMVVAMMLPTSLPLIALFRSVVRRRRDRAWLVALLIAGYLIIWTLFGVLVYFGGWALRLLVEQSAWLEANAWVLGAGVLVLAGLYQFTPLKFHCLEKCRSPLSFVTEHWRGSHERSRSFRLGAHHGLFCVGCCWSLMLLMFLVGGVGSFGWMLALGAVMAVEKNMAWGRRIGAPLGVILVGLGVTLGTASALQSFGDTLARITLAPANDSGVSGVATLTDTSDGVEVRLNVRGLPEPEAVYLAHIHPGSCTEERAGDASDHTHGHHAGSDEPAGEIEYPLTPVVAKPEGTGSSTTVINGATVQQFISGKEFYLNVHDKATGSEELPDSLTCGDLLVDDEKIMEHAHE